MMKKHTLALAITTLISPLALSNLAHADTIFGIYAGAGSWQTDYSGEAGDPALSAGELGIDEKNNTFFYIALEHPVPLIPNIKIQQTDLTSRQTATITENFTIDDEDFFAGDEVTTDFDLSHTDATLYYEILDNWVNADVGVTVRKYSGYMKAEAESESVNKSENVDIDQTLPMLYAKFQFDLPFTGFSAGLEGNYISYSDSTLSDFSAKVGYMFDSAFDIGLELGYRQSNMKLDEDDVTADLELSGPYLAALFHF